MNDWLPSSPFTKRVRFIGVFEKEDTRSQPVTVEIAYSLTNSHSPKGIIRGTGAQYDALERFLLPAPLCSLRSISEARNQIICKVRMSHLSRSELPTDERDTIHEVLGYFFVREIAMTHDRGLQGQRPQATFLLSGPRKLWQTWSTPI